MPRLTLRLLTSILIVALIGCESSPTDDGDETGAIALDLSSSTVSIMAGESGSLTANVTRSGGFTGAVTVGIDAVAGVTATPATIAEGANSGTVTLQVDPSVAPGSVALTVRATGSGVADAIATATLTVTAVPTPDFTLAVSPAQLPLEPGGDAVAEISIQRSGGFTGAVALSVSGLPEGVEATFDPAAPTGASATLTLTAEQDAVTGAADLTITGSADGMEAKTATLALSVSAAADFGLAATPAAVSLAQGEQTIVTVAITRTGGFDGDVTLAASGLPAGVDAAFDPVSTAGDVSTLTLTAAAGAAEGSVPLTITGTAAGLDDRTAQVDLTVTATTGGGAGNVTWTFCGFTGVPIWVAYRDGDGPWARVQPEPGNRYSFQIDEPRGQVAYVVMESGAPELTVAHYSREELIFVGEHQCDDGFSGKTVHGSVAALGPLEAAFVSLGAATAQVAMGATGTNFTLENVLHGPQDLVATRTTFDLGALAMVPDRMVIRRNLDPADGSTLPPLDFDAEGFLPVSADVTVAGMTGGEQSTVVGMFATRSGSVANYFTGVLGGASQRYWGVPAEETESTDLHWLQVVATDVGAAGGPIPPPTRQVAIAFDEVQDRNVTLGPPLATPTVTRIGFTNNARFRASWTRQSEYDRFVALVLHQPDGLDDRSVALLATSSYLEGGATIELEVPDLTDVEGWNTSHGLDLARSTLWTVTGSSWTGAGSINFPDLVDGTLYYSATRSGEEEVR